MTLTFLDAFTEVLLCRATYSAATHTGRELKQKVPLIIRLHIRCVIMSLCAGHVPRRRGHCHGSWR